MRKQTVTKKDLENALQGEIGDTLDLVRREYENGNIAWLGTMFISTTREVVSCCNGSADFVEMIGAVEVLRLELVRRYQKEALQRPRLLGKRKVKQQLGCAREGREKSAS